MHELSVCLLFRNEQDYIQEWLDYYIHILGADHFYLYDNNTDDDTYSVLHPYVEKGLVDITLWPGHTRQTVAYFDCCQKRKSDSKWIAFVDSDEFIFSPKYYSLKDTLKQHDHFDALQMYWWIFGSSGHIKKRDDLVIERFLRCGHYQFPRKGPRLTPKSIVKPGKVVEVLSGHTFNVTGDTKIFDMNDWRINHYALKSVQEFNWKWNERGRGTDYKPQNKSDYWKRFNVNKLKDNGMLVHAETLKSVRSST